MNYDILLAGFGGQGILFAGKAIAYSGLTAGKEVSWLPSYGPEMRGGTCNCSVCISEEPIGSPLVLNPDVLIAMNTPSLEKFINNVKTGGTVIIDSSMCDVKVERTDVNVHYIPATELTTEDPEIRGGANIILLGKMFEETKMFPIEIVKKSFEKMAPKKLDNNMKAIKIGSEYAE